MKIALFYYDGFSEFEMVLIGLFFKQHKVISVTLEKREYLSEEYQRLCVDQVIQEDDAAADTPRKAARVVGCASGPRRA